MPTTRRTPSAADPAANGAAIPPLYNGDRLTQAEFHRRYEAMPEDVKAELIGGVVYMSSPLRRPHGTYHFKLSLVLGLYEAATPGTEGGDNMTTILDNEREPQPDLLLRILTEYGGQSHYNDDEYLVGAPELAVEVAHSTESIDLGGKRLDYLRTGVLEYLVVCLRERAIHWFHFPSRRKLRPDKQGVWRSKVFPGLWLDGPALFARDSARLMAAVQQGVADPEHAAFVARLGAARGRR
jgi:Uma2 family endonuclease